MYILCMHDKRYRPIMRRTCVRCNPEASWKQLAGLEAS